MSKYRRFVGFLWLAVCALACDARSYNESELEELYENAGKLYQESEHHWGMTDGYSDMVGTPGMKVCFAQGPELDALVLGGEFSNTTSNSTLELQHNGDAVQLPDSPFTLALWYSFRPVDFFTTINDTMECDLLQLGNSNKKVKISYSGPKEYNLKYQYQSTDCAHVIDDDVDRPYWEFEVNDTTDGDIKKQGWQWNHIALVVEETTANELTAYYNGFRINQTLERDSSSGSSSSSSKLLLNVPVDGKPPCTMVGFDEVTVWRSALTAEDILALRVHVGRNRSLDEPEPTTLADTTLADTTLADTTPESGDTTAGDTTAGDTTVGDTTPTMDGESTVTSSPLESTQKSTTGEMSSSTTPTDQTTGGMVKSTGPTVTQQRSSPTAANEATTQSGTENAIDDITEIISSASPQVKANKLNEVEQIVGNASVNDIHKISDNLVKLLDKASQTPPATVNSSSKDIAELRNYRKAFVNLFSSILEQWEEVEVEESIHVVGNGLVHVMDEFLTNYVEDPTVNETESINSNGVDVQLAPANGSTVKLEGNTNVSIPVDAFDFETKGVKVLICVLKKGMQNLLEPKGGQQPVDIKDEYNEKPTWNISGPILVMRVSGRTGSVTLQKPISFEVEVNPDIGENPTCVFQNGSSWSGKGLDMGQYDKNCPCVICKTTHMTNFAVLMSVNRVKVVGPHSVLLSIISYIGCSLSLLCLLIAIIMFILLRELNSTRMGIVKNLCVALFFAQLLFVAGIETAKVNEIACKAVAAMLHYFFLCVMAWLLCNGIYLYQKVKKATRPGSVVDLIYFCILGWGAPAVVVAITAGINHEVYGTKDLCWLSVEGAGIWAFVGPAMLIIVFNAFVTFLTMKAFVSVKVFKDKSDKDKFKSGLRAVVVLLPILGLSWIFGLLAFGESTIFFQYLFAIFNSLQGVFLFIFHVLLNDEVKGAMRRRFGKVGASGDENMLFNKIWAFSSSAPEKSTEMSSFSQNEKKFTKPVYKN
ncbi:adhesion G protein-coupled receptor L3-like [Acanthaster planci]|uniref:Adhesion G protein-coupled receptor L3-like n=1 Tax=Acanthaster planci TaxID=133434 RepID=A0A8B7YVM3_ACAPL|nr:adhesion G protein-coupled receptor L3-like [Acanthaster planci]